MFRHHGTWDKIWHKGRFISKSSISVAKVWTKLEQIIINYIHGCIEEFEQYCCGVWQWHQQRNNHLCLLHWSKQHQPPKIIIQNWLFVHWLLIPLSHDSTLNQSKQSVNECLLKQCNIAVTGNLDVKVHDLVFCWEHHHLSVKFRCAVDWVAN